ncbi:hypothetical protein [Stenotrophomonas sp. NA06056]|uniref:hypothetical protein n=1 Tax=Stenotrophomonas sp. NA06056 TaxID=2742129 RepID=UPI00158DC2C2|nr:hypothetical protein [Stenotrophomonas sp. NA06056]QKW56933.1 hypothetical protein HUT07_10010 [Stenotrophomonas sp. NA06056]
MRSLALLPLLWCVAGVAQATPASDADVAAVVKSLGMGSLGATMADLVIDNTPALKALPDADQACAQAPVGDLLDAQFRRSIIQGLGNDGDVVIAEWSRFLATTAGKALSSTFANSTPDNTEAKAGAGLGATDRAQLAAFMASPAYRRMVASFESEPAIPEDLDAQLAKPLQDQCRIALKPEEIS